MKVYVSHKRNESFKEELYEPIEDSRLFEKYEFIFPHSESNEPFSSREMFLNKEIGLVLAEVSYPATGQGIELGWANAANVPIVCFFKKGFKIANSLKAVSNDFIEYENSKDLISKLEEVLIEKTNN